MQTPTPEEIDKWNRWFAIELNNLAWTLAEKSDRTPAEGEEMLHAGHASALHWSRVGTERNKARADILLAQVHALLGNDSIAMIYARRGHEYVTSHESPDWEMALAQAVLANAAYAAKEMGLYSQHYARAKSLGEVIANAEDKDMFQRTFIQLPVPQDVSQT